ncbi:hypothetical protein CLHUN_16890 [Ruminiclostridium hungatei]|uniref:Uncharacterized protein n=1 Tax=Ruminiclostridium hungatei TaxID=48256 RepID=A0A1V4SKL3_RUMHU|nr:hypothetical protein [Ruminiclostridium hungatei]OPX44390.1 hypothetical protein CLHUN_16890 [Ruminiclostridium hungatei]
MIQTYTMILWAHPGKEDFETVVKKAYAALQSLAKYGEDISPNYLTVSRKKDAKPFEWSFEAFRELVANSVNKEGGKVFTELGYTFSFFSSLNNKESAGISMTTGITDPRFKNTFTVNFPQSYLMSNPDKAERTVSAFTDCIRAFEPYWGCVANSANSLRFSGYYREGLPTAFHWLNYFGREITEKLGKEKLDKLPIHTARAVEDGYLLRLDEAPLDDENSEAVSKQKQVNEFLGLNKFTGQTI